MAQMYRFHKNDRLNFLLRTSFKRCFFSLGLVLFLPIFISAQLSAQSSDHISGHSWGQASEQSQFIAAVNALRQGKAISALTHDPVLDRVMDGEIVHSVKSGKLDLDMDRVQAALKKQHYPFLRFGVRAFSGTESGREGLNYLLSLKNRSLEDDILSRKVTHIGAAMRLDARQYPYWIVIFASQLPQKEEDALVSKQFLAYFNAFRRKHNLPKVRLNTKLYQASLGHAKDMAQNKFMGHTGSNGSDIGDRVTKVGYMFRGVAENVAVGYSTALDVLLAWENSPGHLKNMLGKKITEIGIAATDGVFPSDSGQAGRYWALTLGWERE